MHAKEHFDNTLVLSQIHHKHILWQFNSTPHKNSHVLFPPTTLPASSWCPHPQCISGSLCLVAHSGRLLGGARPPGSVGPVLRVGCPQVSALWAHLLLSNI